MVSVTFWRGEGREGKGRGGAGREIKIPVCSCLLTTGLENTKSCLRALKTHLVPKAIRKIAILYTVQKNYTISGNFIRGERTVGQWSTVNKHIQLDFYVMVIFACPWTFSNDSGIHDSTKTNLY